MSQFLVRMEYKLCFGIIFIINVTLVVSELYYNATIQKTWQDAYDDCISRNMELAVLNSEAIYNDATGLISSTWQPTGVWIGFKIKKADKTPFEWINKEDNVYEPWGPNQPDYLLSDSCAYIDISNNYLLTASTCSSTMNYICTSPSAPVVEDHDHTKDECIGSQSDFHCFYFSLWPVKVEWILDTGNETIIIKPEESPTLYEQIDDNSSDRPESTLNFVSLQADDYGSYRCRVTDTFGMVGLGPENIMTQDMDFKLETVTETWETAVLKCKNGGKELAVLNTQELHEAAKDYINSKRFSGLRVWIGMYGEVSSQTLFWINGVAVTYLPWSTSNPINWGQPVSTGTTCVALDKSNGYKFVEGVCTAKYEYLCMAGSTPTVHTDQTRISIPDENNQMILNCPYTSPWHITDVIWEKKTVQGIETLDQSKDPNMYNGGTIHSPALVIKILNVDPEGMYRCFVKNKFGFGKGEFITVNVTTVEWPPIILTTTTEFIVNVSDSVTFVCDVDASPPITSLVWSKDGGGMSTVIDTTNNMLTIDNTRLTDSGQYTCTATNDEGVATEVYTLTVLEVVWPPIILPTNTEVEVNVSYSVTFVCDVDASPNITSLIWSKDEGGTTTIISTTYLTSSLTLNNVDLDDSGQYNCIATNSEGVANLTFTLTVLEDTRPPIIKQSQTDFVVNETKSVTFDCNTKLIPTVANRTWLKLVDGIATVLNQGPMSSNISLTNIQETDGGHYMCIASNEFGASNKTFTLTVKLTPATCTCDCWSLKHKGNYTIAELKEHLRPITEKLRKELTVNTSTLSSTINKRISKQDGRKSSQQIGVIGIMFLSLIFGMIIVVDITSIPQHAYQIRNTYNNISL